ncbi:MAG: iron-containing alcohol dehydrogenase [Clostridia bacterium]|nr:iron-containing alcohol dehydrogenase [Clostridia bacterium]
MNIFKRIYCRVYQTAFYLLLPFLPYRTPEILSGAEDIARVIKQKGFSRVLIVTDGFLKSSGATQNLENTLVKENLQIAVFSQVNANPTVINVESGLEIYKEHNAECIIAFGGGSAMDCAKAIGARVAYPRKSLEKLKGLLKVRKKIPLLFACPTTAGTGSEVTVTSVITDSEKHHKYTMNSFALIPSYAVLDAKATLTLPKHLTSTTGMDALTHAVEAFIGRSTTRSTRAQATQATKLIFENILTAYNQPTNLVARENMLKAAYLAGLAFTKSYVGYVHAIAHSLGGKYNVAHGLANSVLLPVVLKGYGKSAHKKLYKLALATDVCEKQDSYEVGAKKFIQKIEFLLQEMSIPTYIDKIEEKDIPEMAEHADKEANPLYPVPKLFDGAQLSTFYYQIIKKD